VWELASPKKESSWAPRSLGTGLGRLNPAFSSGTPTSASSSGDSDSANQVETRSTRLVSGAGWLASVLGPADQGDLALRNLDAAAEQAASSLGPKEKFQPLSPSFPHPAPLLATQIRGQVHYPSKPQHPTDPLFPPSSLSILFSTSHPTPICKTNIFL
jgi:hypothetical protein